MHTASVGQSSVYHRTTLIDPPSQWGDDSIDHVEDVLVAVELDILAQDQILFACDFDIDLIGLVNHDFSDVGVDQQSFQRPVAYGLVQNGTDQLDAIFKRDQPPFVLDHSCHTRLDMGAKRLVRQADQLLQSPRILQFLNSGLY